MVKYQWQRNCTTNQQDPTAGRLQQMEENDAGGVQAQDGKLSAFDAHSFHQGDFPETPGEGSTEEPDP